MITDRQSTGPASAPAPQAPAWLDETLYPFEHHYLDLDGHQIHYIDEGTGPTLLFLHANPLWSFQYRNIIRPLRDRFRCIALDYPGFGLSDAAPGYHNALASNAQLVERFISTLQLSGITLVVHDSSTAIGLGVVVNHPEWFAGLVISNGFAFPLDGFPGIDRFLKIVSSRAVRFLVVNFDLLTRFTARTIVRGSLAPAERRAYLGPTRDRNRRHHQHDLFKSIVQSHDYLADLEQRLLTLPVWPTLLMFTETDSTYKAGFLDRMEQLFPRHRSIRLPGPVFSGADHFPQEYTPQQMAATIQEWWESDIDR